MLQRKLGEPLLIERGGCLIVERFDIASLDREPAFEPGEVIYRRRPLRFPTVADDSPRCQCFVVLIPSSFQNPSGRTD